MDLPNLVVCVGYRCTDFHFFESIWITFKYCISSFDLYVGICNDISNVIISRFYAEIYSRVERLDQFLKAMAGIADLSPFMLAL